MQCFVDVTIFIVYTHDNREKIFEEISPIKLIKILKQKLINKSVAIPFSGKFEFVSLFGNDFKIGDNTDSLCEPYDIKIDNILKLIFVADYDNKRIVVFDLEGNYLFYFTTPGNPSSLFVDENRDRLILSCDYSIYSCNKKGDNFIKIYDKGRLFAVTMDPITNYIYASDPETGKIVVFDMNGKLKFEIKRNFTKPYGLILNLKRELLISDSFCGRIQVYDCEGKFIKSIKGPFETNWGITIDKTNNNIFVADFMDNKVHALDYNGKLIKSINRNELINPIQLDYCSVNGYVYVCGSNNVLIFK